MKPLLRSVIGLLAAFYIVSCNVKENQEGQSTSSAVTPQEKQTKNPVLSENFTTYLNRFAERDLPAKFLFNDAYSDGEENVLDHHLVDQFVDESLRESDTEVIYYLASLKIHPKLYSVVVLQLGYRARPTYLMINYDAQGTVVSSRVIAYYQHGGGMASWASATIHPDGRMTIVESEEATTSGDVQQWEYAFKITPEGGILPDVPDNLVTTYHGAVKKGNDYLMDAVYGSDNTLTTTAFTLRKQGDSTFFVPGPYHISVDAPDAYEWIVDSFAKTKTGYKLSLKDVSFAHSHYDRMTRIALNKMSGNPGLYQFVLSRPEPEYNLITEVRPEFVATEEKFHLYKKRIPPLVEAGHSISPSGGLYFLWLEATKDHEIKNWGSQHGFAYKGGDNSDGLTYHTLYDRDNKVTLEIGTDKSSSDVKVIHLYSPVFKTDGGIGVGSTLGDLLYAHEDVSVISGEGLTLVSIDRYKHTAFILDYVAGPPDSEIDTESLDKTLKIIRIDFRDVTR